MTTKRSRRRHEGRTRAAALEAARRRNTELVERVDHLAGRCIHIESLLDHERSLRAAQLGLAPSAALHATLKALGGPDKLLERAVNSLVNGLMPRLLQPIIDELAKPQNMGLIRRDITDFIRHGYVKPRQSDLLEQVLRGATFAARVERERPATEIRLHVPEQIVAIKV